MSSVDNARSDEIRNKDETVELLTRGPGLREYGIGDQIVQLVAVYLWLGWLSIITLVMALCVFASWPARITLVILLVTGAILPIPRFEDSLGPVYSAFGNFLMRRASEYFSLRVQMTQAANEALNKLRAKGTPVVIGLEPHAVIPFSIFFAHSALETMPLKDARGMMSSILFRLPGMRQTYRSVSACGAEKKTMCALLDKGISCMLIPGGVQEVPLLNKGSDKDLYLYLSKRFGFVKVALEKGAPIVPAFCFGILETYSWWILPGKIFERIGRTIGFMPMIYFGAMGVPLGLPKKVPLTVLVGEPINGPALPKVPAGCEPGALLSDEQEKQLAAEIDSIVQATHAKYVEAMVGLFKAHKHRFNMGDWTLHIE
eukprot:TRINITY_DN17503_c1_g1_i1.p1 TRINITY_DN17503_c1_g1~~TRINITY_DN17503_c1_g1_i1.p1  ORF type:complete len:372 (+),score=59.78 TRINITY_DN17503_c1_g1_i1:140-1255(+)